MDIRNIIKPTYLKIAVSITMLIVIAYFLSPPFLDLVELKALDIRFKGRPGVQPGEEVAIIAIDEKSLKELGRWPWPRSVMARLIDSLTSYDVKVMGFDIVFAEESQNRDEDAALARAIEKSGRVILGYFFSFGQETPGREGRELDSFYEVKTLGHGTDIISADGVVGNIDSITEEAGGFGYFNITPDMDGAVRWDPLIINYKERYYPPLALQTLRSYLGNPPLTLTLADYGVMNLKFGDISIPVDEEGRMLVNYYGGQKAFPHYSASDIIFNRIQKERLKGRIALIGPTATGIYDMRVTPFEATYPGVEIHATVMDNILHQRFITRPQWLAIIDIMAILIIGIILGLIVPRLSALKGLLFATTVLIGYLFVNLYVFSTKGIWINAVYPAATVILTYPMIILYRYITEEREKRWIKGAFQYYVTASVMEEILKRPEMLKLGGEEKELTVLFSDIRGFTTISERLSPEQMVSLLNEYLTSMTDIVFEHRGYLDKYIGDAIMVVYGAPVPQSDHPIQACLTAVDMMTELRRLQERWEREGLPFMDIGIGINTGPMVIGNMGSKSRFNYTVIGDSVNLASRLEGLNKTYGTHIIISESVYRDVSEIFLCRELDTVKVKGKLKPSLIYELVGKRSDSRALVEFVETFHKGLGYYKDKDWEMALMEFEAVLRIKPDDRPSEIYVERCRRLMGGPAPDLEC